ncbi:HNH endonuclease [Bacillus sp. 1P06AnD]|uniref:HNH endonuclease n=1 Tax=Bacillus sp. 1P06AnD TaxID=3132208 RepID=UPI0039A39C23
MIPLTRPPKPSQLTDETIIELTERFKADKKKSVWKVPYITEALYEMSNNKCAYCECYIGVEGKYMQVEHYHPKSLYEDEVVNWDNLLPSCNRCNIAKSNHDTKLYPLVNPSIDTPNLHLEFCTEKFRIIGIDDKGKLTEKLIGLNDYKAGRGHAVTRFLIIQALIDEIEEFKNMLMKYSPQKYSIEEKIELRNKFKNILENGQPKAAYSATVATIIISNPNYEYLRDEMIKKGIWYEELDYLEKKVKKFAFKIYSEATNIV